MKKVLAVVGAWAILAVLGLPALGHEFLAKPDLSKGSGGTVPVTLVSTHVFMAGEELEDAAEVKAWIRDASGQRAIPLKRDEKALAFVGEARPSGSGPWMVLAHRLPQTWTRTTEGMKRGTLADFPGATVSNVYEKFAKALGPAGSAGDWLKKPVGHELEIAPVSDPAEFAAGKEVDFQVLFQGQPLSTEVLATYDGFSANPNTYAYFTEADDQGVARVKLTAPGLWMVRVQHKAPGEAGIKEYVRRAVLVFGVH